MQWKLPVGSYWPVKQGLLWGSQGVWLGQRRAPSSLFYLSCTSDDCCGPSRLCLERIEQCSQDLCSGRLGVNILACLGWCLAMSVPGKAVRSGSASSPDLDPLLKDLSEKRLSFRRNVASLASELKDVRNKLASQEQLFTRESQTRKVSKFLLSSCYLQYCLQVCSDKREHGRLLRQRQGAWRKKLVSCRNVYWTKMSNCVWRLVAPNRWGAPSVTHLGLSISIFAYSEFRYHDELQIFVLGINT